MSAQAKKTGAVQKVSASAKQKSKTATYAPVAQKPILTEKPNPGSELLEAVTGILRCNLHSNLKIEAHSHVDGFSISVNTNTLPDLDLPINQFDDQIFPELSNTLTPPLPGQYWKGQGGFYAGIMVDGGQAWHLIDSPSGHTLESCEWGKMDYEVPGKFSRRDGQHNTALILASDPDNKAAAHCTALLVDGHKDFYWPSQFELDLINISRANDLDKKTYWSSTQYSADHAWCQDFEDGYTGIYGKDYKRAVRAVRRILINSSIQ